LGKRELTFLLAFSPGCENPGNRQFRTAIIPKIVGGVNPESTEAAAAPYAEVMAEVVPVSSTRVAEASKLPENTYRAVNIALVNELVPCVYQTNALCMPVRKYWH
jgi:UDP-N-acetyl-D-glucosamine dehydrogenase